MAPPGLAQITTSSNHHAARAASQGAFSKARIAIPSAATKNTAGPYRTTRNPLYGRDAIVEEISEDEAGDLPDADYDDYSEFGRDATTTAIVAYHDGDDHDSGSFDSRVNENYRMPAAMSLGAAIRVPSPQQQKDQVNMNLGARLTKSSTWNLVGQRWWQEWKNYVNLDGDDDMDEDSKGVGVGNNNQKEDDDVNRPGPIDNASLLEPGSEVALRKGLIENNDYVMIPNSCWNKLHRWYGGGPEISRRVISRGEPEEATLELYPLVFHLQKTRALDGRALSRTEVVYISRIEDLSQAKQTICTRLGVRQENARLWLKPLSTEIIEGVSAGGSGGGGAAAAAESKDGGNQKDSDSDYEMVDRPGASTNQEGNDEDDEDEENAAVDPDESKDDEEWKLLEVKQMKAGTKLQTLCGEELGLRVLVECKNMARDPWPREEIANRWRYELKVGDKVDGMDSEKKWYASIIVDAEDEPRGKVKVHFRGWQSKWDTWKERSDSGIQKLFTNTNDWRDLRTNDKCEVKFPGADGNMAKGKWFEGKVDRVVRAGDEEGLAEVPEDAKRQMVEGAQESDAAAGDDGDEPRYVPLPPPYVLVKCDKRDDVWKSTESEELCEQYTHIGASKKTYSNYSSSYSSGGYRSGYGGGGGWGTRSNTRGVPAVEGAVGLSNLGNTCFMNSMLQCLSNTQGLSEYFQRHQHTADINTDNPLGCGGRLAEAYAGLVSDMWSGEYTVCVPQALKHAVAQHAPQFSGYQQQDSQELMSYLLDGLHEDLNRVHNKPYVEKKDSNGRPDHIVAEEAWRGHLARNDSIVVDKCQGQLKSHIVCPDCGQENTTFDPYTELSLPLPVANMKRIDLTVVLLNPQARPVKLLASVENTAAIGDLASFVANALGDRTLEDRLHFCDIYSCRVYETKRYNAGVTDIADRDHIIAYEVDDSLTKAEQMAQKQEKKGWGMGMMSTLGRRKTNTNTDARRIPEIDILFARPAPTSSRSGYGSGGYSTGSTFYRNGGGGRAGSGGTSYSLFGSPLRVTYRSNVNGNNGSAGRETTNQDMWRTCWERVSRTLGESVRYQWSFPDNLPFTLMMTNLTGATNEGVLPCNDEPFTPPEKRAITLDFTAEGASAIDQDEFDAVEYHESYPPKMQEEDRRRRQGDSAGVRVSGGGSAGYQEESANALELTDCFDKFSELETLDEAEMWYCPNCKEHKRATKKMDLWSTPDYLIIHLKRFLYTPGTYFVHRDKIDAFVNFPLTDLDLRDRVKGPVDPQRPPIYNLYGVSEHSGGLGGGHYTAVAQNFRDGRWYNFNDSSCSPCTPESGITSRAYVLFYKRVGVDEG